MTCSLCKNTPNLPGSQLACPNPSSEARTWAQTALSWESAVPAVQRKRHVSHPGWSPCPPCSKVAPARTASSRAVLDFKNIHVKNWPLHRSQVWGSSGDSCNHAGKEKGKNHELVFKKSEAATRIWFFSCCLLAGDLSGCMSAEHCLASFSLQFSLNPAYKQAESCLPLFLLGYLSPSPQNPKAL